MQSENNCWCRKQESLVSWDGESWICYKWKKYSVNSNKKWLILHFLISLGQQKKKQELNCFIILKSVFLNWTMAKAKPNRVRTKSEPNVGLVWVLTLNVWYQSVKLSWSVRFWHCLVVDQKHWIQWNRTLSSDCILLNSHKSLKQDLDQVCIT